MGQGKGLSLGAGKVGLCGGWFCLLGIIVQQNLEKKAKGNESPN